MAKSLGLFCSSGLPFVAALFACLSFGSLSLGQQPEGDKPSPQVLNENYRIGPADILDVTVSKTEALSRNGLRVSNRGTIQLPMLDQDTLAACLTERELADVIKEKYKKYLLAPYVTVTVREFNSNPVAVIGAVNAPGRFQLQRPVRIAELMTFVNGPTANAGRTIEILRNSSRPYCEDSKFVIPEDGDEEFLSIPIADTFRGGENANPRVRAGDIVRVPEASHTEVYVQGSVKTGAIINLKEPVSLTRAIAIAGGLAPGAQTDRIRIRREIAGSINRQEIIINLKEINQGVRDDIFLQANDIVDVPGPSGIKKVFRDIINGVIPMVTQLPTRVIY